MIAIGDLLAGRYKIIGRIGEGGMASVYKAFDILLERDVAIKFITWEGYSPAGREQLLKRFNREAKVLANLVHPNIVNIFDFGEYNNAPFLVLQYIPGGTLREKIKAPVPYQQAVNLILPIARALEYAHEQGIIHRDIKPANILMTSKNQPMLSDFGISAMLTSTGSTALTGTGVGIGTPEYMAPEQWVGKAVAQSDIYGLGAVLYELVTGKKPHEADTPAGVLIKQTSQPLRPPRELIPSLPVDVEMVIQKALAKNTSERYANMTSFCTALDGLIQRDASVDREANKETAVFTHEAVPRREPPKREDAAKTERLDLKTEKIAGPNKKMPIWIIGGIGLAVIAVVTVGILYVTGQFSPGGRKSSIAPPAPTQTQPVPAVAAVSVTPTMPTVTATSQPVVSRTVDPSPAATQAPASTIAQTTTAAIAPGATMVSEKDGMTLVFVPEGNFWIDQIEVTNKMYLACMDAGVCTFSHMDQTILNGRVQYYNRYYYYDFTAGNVPVTYIDVYDAEVYCEWAGRRIPSADEWGLAAGGPEHLLYPWGNAFVKGNANSIPGVGKAVEGRQYPLDKSVYGAYDMGGNVAELVAEGLWCGGSYASTSENATVAAEDCKQFSDPEGIIGFRCVMPQP